MTRVSPSAEQRFAIEDLYSAYFWALDTHDIEAYLDAFWDDATLRETQLDGAVEDWRGVSAIREFSETHFGGYSGYQHRDSTRMFIADPDGDPDRWQVYAYWCTTHRDADTQEVSFLSTGYSRDIVEYRDGSWKFALRWLERWPGAVMAPWNAAPLQP